MLAHLKTCSLRPISCKACMVQLSVINLHVQGELIVAKSRPFLMSSHFSDKDLRTLRLNKKILKMLVSVKGATTKPFNGFVWII